MYCLLKLQKIEYLLGLTFQIQEKEFFITILDCFSIWLTHHEEREVISQDDIDLQP